jgi:AbrB family looped-hinge helix DNA binding protein
MATITAKVGPKYQLVIPKKLRTAAKLKVGDFLKAELRGDGILLTPMDLLERDLAAAEADVKAGRVYGPFSSAKAVIRSLHREAKKLKKRR